jgi:virulence-associated protein VagC
METVTVFNLGQSHVVTLPKKITYKTGTKLRISRSGDITTLKPVKSKTLTKAEQLAKDLKYVRDHAGIININSPLTPEEMNNLYDEEVYGGLLPRR